MGGRDLESQSLWIVGAPRSGTTFLAALLNAHPQITLTVESRLFALLKQVVDVDCNRPDLLDAAHRHRFAEYIKRNAGALVERYYREGLGVDTPIWGDKHPPYGDPALLSGRDGPWLREPESGSALRLIDEVLPNSKFIHIHRPTEQVAQSLLSRGWVSSLAEGMAVRRQYIDEIEGFFASIDGGRRLTLDYARLLDRPDEAAACVAEYLGVAVAPLTAFLHAERRNPTPFSAPVRNLTDVYRAL